jgi:hypothetical protein
VYDTVLPFIAEGQHGDNATHIDNLAQHHDAPSQVFDDVNETWFDPDMQDIGWNEEGNYDITGNGLYWFWDSTWGDTRPQ